MNSGSTSQKNSRTSRRSLSTSRTEPSLDRAIAVGRDKLFTADAQLLSYLGVTINVSSLLPDALIADVGHETVHFWFVEAVNTDGEINEVRKRDFEKWASQQGIDPMQCRFLTAFRSRNDSAARKRLKDLADGSYAYFADEPDHELAWYRIANVDVPE